METNQFSSAFPSGLEYIPGRVITIDQVTRHTEGSHVDYSWRQNGSCRYGSSRTTVDTLELMTFAWLGLQP